MADEIIDPPLAKAISRPPFDWNSDSQSIAIATTDSLKYVGDEVENRFDQHTKTAVDSMNRMTSSAKKLEDAALAFNPGVPEVQAIPLKPLDVNYEKPELTRTDHGDLTLPDMPEAPDLKRPTVDIPLFESIVKEFNLPVTPTWQEPDAVPVKPELTTITFPEDVVIEFPDFNKFVMPTYNGTLPSAFTGTLDPKFDYAEEHYHPELIEELIPALRELWQGKGGLPQPVMAAMVARALDAEDLVVKRDVDAAIQEFSSRGFRSPPGQLLARIDTIRRDGALRKNAAVRDLNIRFSEITVDLMKYGMEQYVAAENAMYNIFSNTAARTLEVAKFTSEMAIRVYDASVAAHNLSIQRSQLEIQVFSELVRGALAGLEANKLELDVLRSKVDIFKARMEAASIKAETNRTIIEGYKAEVTAYGETIAAQKMRFDAFEAATRGEAAKGAIIDAEAKAYAALLQGIGTKLTAEVEGNKAELSIFDTAMSGFKVRTDALLGVFNAKINGFSADVDKYKADAGLEESKARVAISYGETEMRNTIAYFEAMQKQYQTVATIAGQKAQLLSDSYKAITTANSTLAAGAMAGISVGAQLHGNAQIQTGASFNESRSQSVSAQA